MAEPEQAQLAPDVAEALHWVIFTDPLVREGARAVLRQRLSAPDPDAAPEARPPGQIPSVQIPSVQIIAGLLDQAARCPPGVDPEPLLLLVAEALCGDLRALLRGAPGGTVRREPARLAAVQARLPQIRAWLHAERLGLRAHAALILACMATNNPIPAEQIAGRLQQETDRAVAATLLLCLGIQSLSTMLPVRALRLLQKGWSDPLVSACALLARTLVDGRALEEGAEPLVLALREGWIDPHRLPVREGDLAAIILARAPWLGEGVRERLRAELPLLLERHREGPQASRLELLLELHLGPGPGEPRTDPVEPLTADRLEGPRRATLIRLTELGLASEVFARYGLPADVAGRQRLLGMSSPGILERLVAPEALGLPEAGGPRPLYELLALQGDVEEESLFERLAPVLSSVERASLCAELRRRPYGLRVPLGRTVLMVAAAVEDEEMPALQQLLMDMLSEHHGRGRLPLGTGEGLIGNALLARYLDSMPGEHRVPEELIPLIALVPPPELVHELLSALPPEDRERVLLPKVEQGTDLALSWIVDLLPLCPTPRLVDAFVCSLERAQFPAFRAELARRMQAHAQADSAAALLMAAADRVLRNVPPEDSLIGEEEDEGG